MAGIRIAIAAATLELAACHDNGTGNAKVTGKASNGESITSKILALPRPSASEMDQVDNALDGRACIGKIQTWWRDYGYQLVDHLVDGKPAYNADVIEFLLIESKRKTTVASRSAGPPGSTHIRVEFVPTVVGSFQGSTKKLSIDYCEQHSKR
jgi:hypothetical protein